MVDRNIILFHEAQASFKRRHQYVDEKTLSDRYYKSLVQIRDSLKQLAQECEISLKEAMIDLTYIAVGDEIVNQLTEDADED